jgi:mRNA-degrading endonuclease RelE of RelBE toxin-antitoxin system
MNFEESSEFQKERKKLGKKYFSLDEDLKRFQNLLLIDPEGEKKKTFTLLKIKSELKVVKARLMCQSLKDSSLRIIYAYHQKNITFLFIELYQKSNKAREDSKRIEKYLKAWPER